MVHLIITTANIYENYDFRKVQYIESIERALTYKYLFDSCTILECASAREDYLENYVVHYSKVQNQYPEKGLNEMQHLKAFIEQSPFKKEDAIIKLTGRYMLNDSSFFNKVKLLVDRYDGIFKDDGDIYAGQGFHTFLYCMKKYLFLDTINSLNFSIHNMDPIEWGVKDFLNGKKDVYILERLGVEARQGTYGEKVFKC